MNESVAVPEVSLDTPELSLSDYRTIREGKQVSKTPVVPAAEPAAAAVPAEGDAETANGDSQISEDPKPESKPKGDKLNARFSELTAEIKSLKTQLAAKSGTGQTEAETKPAAAAPAVPPPDPADPEPAADKFTDYAEWLKQWNRWDRRQEARAAEAASKKAAAESAAKTRADSWASRVTEISKEHADFEAVALAPNLPVTRVMGDAIQDSELGAKILYELGKTPDEAARISKLAPLAQIREIGKLEAKLAAAAEAAATANESAENLQTPKKAVSKAPAPITPVRGSAATSTAKAVDSMSLSEYRALRESGKLR